MIGGGVNHADHHPGRRAPRLAARGCRVAREARGLSADRRDDAGRISVAVHPRGRAPAGPGLGRPLWCRLRTRRRAGCRTKAWTCPWRPSTGCSASSRRSAWDCSKRKGADMDQWLLPAWLDEAVARRLEALQADRYAERLWEARTATSGSPRTKRIRRSSATPSAGSASSRACGNRSRGSRHSLTNCAPRASAPRSCSAWAAAALRPRCCGRSSASGRATRACTCSTLPCRRVVA